MEASTTPLNPKPCRELRAFIYGFFVALASFTAISLLNRHIIDIDAPQKRTGSSANLTSKGGYASETIKVSGIDNMAKVNQNYCRPTNDGKSITYGPVCIPPSFKPPTEQEYLANGWFHNAILPPNPPEGKIVADTTYIVEDNSVVALYTYEDAPPRVRMFSKLKLYGALAQLGLWDSFQEWLQTQSIEGINAYTAFSLAQDLTDAHPLFKQWYDEARRVLDVDDATAEAILKMAEVDY